MKLLSIKNTFVKQAGNSLYFVLAERFIGDT